MPLRLKKNKIVLKDANGNIINTDIVCAEKVEDILLALQEKSESSLSSIPDDYSSLVDRVEQIEASIENFDNLIGTGVIQV